MSCPRVFWWCRLVLVLVGFGYSGASIGWASVPNRTSAPEFRFSQLPQSSIQPRAQDYTLALPIFETVLEPSLDTLALNTAWERQWLALATKQPLTPRILPPSKKKGSWVLRTLIPNYTTFLLGLGTLIVGFSTFNSQPGLGAAFLSAGTSVLFALPSSQMWNRPTTVYGVLGALVCVASLIAGLLFTTRLTTSASFETGVGLLSASGLHLILQIVGWLNFSHVHARTAAFK